MHSAGDAVCRVDGEDVDEVDAAGVQLLVALAHSLQRQQVTLQLQHASRPLRDACHDLGLAGLLSVPFWHAPALVHWGSQGALQALFSSTVALWRTRGAFTVYLLGWGAAMLAVAGLVALLGTLFGARQALGILTLPIGLVFSAAFYVSLWFSFADTFGAAGDSSDTRTDTRSNPGA